MVKLSRFRLGCSTTSTELPVLDFACTAHNRLTNESRIAPRDDNMVVYAGFPWPLTLAESGFLMMVMMWAFEVFLSVVA
jgi:hypothetical protein